MRVKIIKQHDKKETEANLSEVQERRMPSHSITQTYYSSFHANIHLG